MLRHWYLAQPEICSAAGAGLLALASLASADDGTECRSRFERSLVPERFSQVDLSPVGG